ncbi:hypothetical protein SAY87_015958 [Trapa incisa]|uniref:TPX2 C-terminal domain-containing protein n=1 Tax=Trapa incisa TaxID=236973 RepID=A0AAN7QV25_9MYRT|nr:hypothetical protein SAY87_015958 [Trapa incisa]
MAGEVESSHGFSFEADSVHSGSISFGKFENEPLCWERRSSFSHNRYLEEVEKCSKPGSVNQKKAYFEAHFRKKILSLDQTGAEHQNTDNDSSESTDNREEVQFMSKDFQFSHFEEVQISSEYDGGESEEINNYVKVSMTAEMPIEIDVTDDTFPTEVSEEAGIFTEQRPGGDEKELEVSSEVISLLQNNDTHENISLTAENHLSPEVVDAIDLKPNKGSPESHPLVVPVRRNVPREIPAVSKKKPSGSITKTLPRTDREKPSQRASSVAIPSVQRVPKQDGRERQRSKVMPESKRVGELKGKKFTESSLPVITSIHTRGDSNTTSPRRTEESKKPEANQKTGPFRFKTDERAEKRKEFYMKLEEKMHTKEAEINQIQERVQKRTEVEIKQFRKSLNFKANPMPSFYHTAEAKHSRKTRLTQLPSESPGPVKQSTLKSQPKSKTGTRSVSSASDATKLTDDPLKATGSISTTAAVNGQRGARTLAGSRKMSDEMQKKGAGRVGMNRTGLVAARGVAS